MNKDKILVYKYFLKAPMLNADVVRRQMKIGHDYANMLRQYDAQYRDVVRGVYAERDAQSLEISSLLDARQLIYKELDTAKQKLIDKKVQARARTGKEDEGEAVSALRQQLKKLNKELKVARKKVKLTDVQDTVLKDAKKEYVRCRNRDRKASGLRHGTYCQIEDSIKQASQTTPVWNIKNGKPNDIRQAPWRNEGLVAIQVSEINQLPIEDIYAGKHTFIQLDLKPQSGGKPGSRRSQKYVYGKVRMRVGSMCKDGTIKKGGHTPVWAEWPLKMHREIPAGSVIVEAQILCKREVDREAWSLHVTLKLAATEQAKRIKRHGKGVVAMDLGWRNVDGNGLRVAHFADEYGKGWELRQEPGILLGFRKTDDLASIRKLAQNQLSCSLRTWIDKNDVPEGFKLYTQHMGKWKSRNRFLDLHYEWKRCRWQNDAEGFNLLDSWAYGVYSKELGRRDGGDQHLWQWEQHQREKSIRRRKDQYRREAAWLAEKYDTIVMEKIGLKSLQKNKLPEEKADNAKAKYQQKVAATSEFQACLEQAFTSRGGQVVKVNPAYTSQKCSVCGVTCKANRKGLMYTCKCGNVIDADL